MPRNFADRHATATTEEKPLRQGLKQVVHETKEARASSIRIVRPPPQVDREFKRAEKKHVRPLDGLRATQDVFQKPGCALQLLLQPDLTRPL